MNEARRAARDQDLLAVVTDEMRDALERIDLPTYVINRDGTLHCAVSATSTLIGERVGQLSLRPFRATCASARKRILPAGLSRAP
jgi:hypothetical protein